VASMPIVVADCFDAGYDYQMRGYMKLWDAETWSVDYLLVDTPEDLIGYESPALHYVSHIPEHLRWTTWLVKRDRSIDALIEGKVRAARRYYRQVLNEFDRGHPISGGAPEQAPPWVPVATPAAPPAKVLAPIF
jgi:hypothetical protein